MIIINFKNYKEGDDVLRLAKLIESHMVHATAAVPATYIERIAAKTALNVYAQHVDVIDDQSTGFLGAAQVRASGGAGTILNHSEHPLALPLLKKTIEQCKKERLVTLVCVSSLAEAAKIAAFKPDIMAFEDPKLIASGKSITSQAKTIEKFVALLKGKPIVPLCGAGISRYEDVDAAYKLGCKGVLISSAIARAKHPERLLKELSAWNF